MRLPLKTILVALAMSLGATGARAAPVTWTLTGVANFSVLATGDLSGTIGLNSTYVVTYTFDDPSVSTDCVNPAVQRVCSYGPGVASVAINGMTFTVNTPSPLGHFRRRAFNQPIGVGEMVEANQSDYTTQHLAGGNAVSSLNRDAFITINFNVHGFGDVFSDAYWPSSIDLADFRVPFPTNYSAFSFSFTSASGNLDIFDPITAFETFHSTADDAVPAPGGLALLGLGLFGLGATRRRAA